MTRRLNLILLAIGLLIALPYYWFLIDNSGGTLPAKPITIAQLRTLAASIPGEAPAAFQMERAAFRRVTTPRGATRPHQMSARDWHRR